MIADEFRGDTASLRASIESLLSLDAAGALVPHGIGGHARSLLSAAYCRLPPPQGDADKVDAERNPLIDLILRDLSIDELRAKAGYLMYLNANQARTIAEYEADAARYRHLVETCNVDFDPSEPWQLVIWEPSTGEDWKEKLDAVIDESIAAGLTPGGQKP